MGEDHITLRLVIGKDKGNRRGAESAEVGRGKAMPNAECQMPNELRYNCSLGGCLGVLGGSAVAFFGPSRVQGSEAKCRTLASFVENGENALGIVGEIGRWKDRL